LHRYSLVIGSEAVFETMRVTGHQRGLQTGVLGRGRERGGRIGAPHLNGAIHERLLLVCFTHFLEDSVAQPLVPKQGSLFFACLVVKASQGP
jgi:hypothetical protein